MSIFTNKLFQYLINQNFIKCFGKLSSNGEALNSLAHGHDFQSFN